MSFFSDKRSFRALFIVHFLTCLSDNLYKTLLVFFLLSISPEKSHVVLTLTGLLFVVPFILFADLAGTLGDRCKKTTIIYWTKSIEVVVMALGLWAFTYQSVSVGYIVLFLVACLSAIFSPAKFGILPEICSKEQLSYCNGIMLMTTYIGSILGVFLASYLTQVGNGIFVVSGIVCLGIAIVAGILSFVIAPSNVRNTKRALSFFCFKEVFLSVKIACKTPFLVPCLCGGAFFFFVVTYTQLNLLPFVSEQFGWPEVYAGYLFLIPAISLGLGSWLVGRLSGKKVRIKLLPYMSLGMAGGFLLLCLVGHIFSWMVIALFILGMCAGMYTIPLHTFVQAVSPEDSRARNIAACNFFDFFGVACAAVFIFLAGKVCQLGATTGFGAMAIVSVIVSIWWMLLFKRNAKSVE
ncbi:hypothetical protein CLAVI_000254 [Candidatus Clavichlamydia salmonicola]|uniref:MFS transporter n=1 Tax=Candidatus Clavichlamydia salmonicola TaxID=469812 RepID=UPI0018911606|nr:MFS transporter [Candidatus Clavichlamydia salmonicola]MBF5050640.1 hypothetical protein [Candidatus Clavichlamydia salmonicola]